MMMSSGGRLPQWGITAWFQENGVLFTFLAGQTIAGIMWGANITSRLDTIEQRGSRQVVSLDHDVASIKQWQANHDKIAAENHTARRLAEHESRLSLIEDRDKTLLDIMKQNVVTLNKINEELTRHLIDGNQNKK